MTIVRFSQNGYAPRLGCYVHQAGKMGDSLAPIGPYIADTTEISDPTCLTSRLG